MQGEMRNVYTIYVGKTESKKSPGRPRCRWENNIRNRVGSCELDSSGLRKGPVVSCCEQGNEAVRYIKGGISLPA
jgi:hypothetical protein